MRRNASETLTFNQAPTGANDSREWQSRPPGDQPPFPVRHSRRRTVDDIEQHSKRNRFSFEIQASPIKNRDVQLGATHSQHGEQKRDNEEQHQRTTSDPISNPLIVAVLAEYASPTYSNN